MAQSLLRKDHARSSEALAKAEVQRRQAEQTVAELAAVAASLTPVEPDEEGTVVRFTKWDGYHYAAIRGKSNQSGDGIWYFTQDPTRTGGNKMNPGTWRLVLETVGIRNWDTLEVLS